MSQNPSLANGFLAGHADLPQGDYVAPALDVVMPDSCFPHMARGQVADNDWPYLRRHIGHNWYVDARSPAMGFVSRDEAAILYNQARRAAPGAMLEIGCWRGWSSVHLALGGGTLDIIDPALADADHGADVAARLEAAGVAGRVTLHPASSPDAIAQAAARRDTQWSLVFIDGDHEGEAPARDAEAVLPHLAPDCAVLFHDLTSPAVAAGLRLLEAHGFNIRLFQTMQIMGIAWRGAMPVAAHVPDPAVVWELPHHLAGVPVAGVDLPGHGVALRRDLADARAQTMATQQLLDQALQQIAAGIARETAQQSRYDDLMQQWTDHGFRARLRRWFGRPL